MLERDQLVAALAGLVGKAAAFEPQHLARRRALGNGQHDRAFRRRHLDLGAEHRFLERDRQGQADVLAVASEKRVACDLDGDDGIAAPAGPSWPWPASRILVPLSTPLGSFRSTVLPPASVIRCGFNVAASTNGTFNR